MRAPNILFVLADGGRARFVRRAGVRRGLSTFCTIDGSDRLKQLRAEARGRAQDRTSQGDGSRSHAVEEADLMREGKEAFVADVAARAVEAARDQAFDAIFIVAPQRLLGRLERALPSGTTLAGRLALDLTKTPDAELPRWLHPVGAPAGLP